METSKIGRDIKSDPEHSSDTEESNKNNLTRLNKKGEGVYGVVYSAKEDSGQTFAVKRNLIDVTGDFVGSVRELDILIRLNGHPHIVEVNSISIGDPFGNKKGNMLSPIIDIGYKDDKIHFIFEEAKEDGASFMSDGSWADLRKCMVHLLLALEYCHAKGIIHRDIKPANLLVFETKSGFVFKICDWGLSIPKTYQGIRTPSVVTSWYRAPEILKGEDYDEKVDLWSAGCIFYEMVTKLPLLHGSPDQANKILESLSTFFPNLRIKTTRKIFNTRTRLSWNVQLRNKADTPAMKSQGWDFDLFIDLMGNLLTTKDKRFSASQALDHPFFKDYSEYISIMRYNYPPEQDSEPIFNIEKTPERDAACLLLDKIYRERNKYNWFNNRVLFQGLSLFDRYTSHLKSEEKKIKKNRIRLIVTVCLYIAVKYFSTLSVLIPFTHLYGQISELDKRYAEEIEMYILDKVINYVVYVPTLYEAADTLDEILDDNHIYDLLKIYFETKVLIRGTNKIVSINGLTPSQVYRCYRGKITSEELDY